jgi:invasion protein IalB
MIASLDGWTALRRSGLLVSLAALVWGCGPTLAIAQQAQQPSNPPLKLPSEAGKAQGDYSAWVKLCTKTEKTGNKQVCVVKYEALDPKTGDVLVAAAVRTTEGEDKKDLLIDVPTSFSLVMPAGIRIKIDKEEPISLQYAVCLPTSCQVHTELTKQLLERMRNGEKMLVAAINVQQKPVTFLVRLNGFAKTSDGAPVDTARYQETRHRMMEFAKKAAKEQTASGREVSPSQVGAPNVTTVPMRKPPGESPQK